MHAVSHLHIALLTPVDALVTTVAVGAIAGVDARPLLSRYTHYDHTAGEHQWVGTFSLGDDDTATAAGGGGGSTAAGGRSGRLRHRAQSKPG
jgi:hypothetical protein